MGSQFTCPYCGEVHPPEMRFCPRSGRPLAAPPPMPARTPPPARRVAAVILGIAGLLAMAAGLFFILQDAAPTRPARRAGGNASDSQEQELALAPTAARRGAATSVFESAIDPTREPSATPLPTLTLIPTATATPAPTATAVPTATTIPTATPTTPPTKAPAGPYSGLIAFCYGSDNQREVYLLDPISGQTTQVTSNQWREEGPSFSADNRSMVYASYRVDGWELFVRDMQTKEERQLTRFNGQARFPEWSPVDGDNRIIFEGRADNGAANIYIINADGSDMRPLTSGNSDSSPAWSPDGRRVVYGHAPQDTDGDGAATGSDSEDVYIVDVASGAARALTDTPAIDEILYAWSPDGMWIAVSAVREDADGNGYVNLDDARGLFLISPDGSQQSTPFLQEFSVYSPDWSPDGSQIVFTADVGSQTQVWVYDLNKNGETRQITQSGPYYHTEWAK